MTETENKPPRFDRDRCLQEFQWLHGFNPDDLGWEPVAGVDTRDLRDPVKLGKQILRNRKKRLDRVT